MEADALVLDLAGPRAHIGGHRAVDHARWLAHMVPLRAERGR